MSCLSPWGIGRILWRASLAAVHDVRRVLPQPQTRRAELDAQNLGLSAAMFGSRIRQQFL